MLGKLMNLAVPPWVRIAVPVVLVLLIFGAGMWFMRVLDSAKIAKLEGKVAVLGYAVEDRNETITALKEAAAEVTRTLATNHTAMKKAEADLAEYLARPPRTVTRWRERAAEVPDIIPSGQPCTVQVHTAFTALQRALRERGTP